MRDPVYIHSAEVLTPAGSSLKETWASLSHPDRPHFLDRISDDFIAGLLCSQGEDELAQMRSKKQFKSMDRAILLGVLSARKAVAGLSFKQNFENFGVIYGSSRGATSRLEEEHAKFMEGKKISLQTSPQTTFGSFSAAIAREVGASGVAMSVSSACSTSLNAVGLAASLIQARVIDGAFAGGCEAAITPFTLAQMTALGVYAKIRNVSAIYPYQPFHMNRCGMILGEGAACLILSKEPHVGAIGSILGYGAATEVIESSTGISEAGSGLVAAANQAMRSAGLDPTQIDLIVAHGAGTKKGDASELNAYRTLFSEKIPPIAVHKWATGHMLGAGGAVSVAVATKYLTSGFVPKAPYFDEEEPIFGRDIELKKARHALVCSLGFGGSAAALIVGSQSP